jgi:hypothetical protein
MTNIEIINRQFIRNLIKRVCYELCNYSDDSTTYSVHLEYGLDKMDGVIYLYEGPYKLVEENMRYYSRFILLSNSKVLNNKTPAELESRIEWTQRPYIDPIIPPLIHRMMNGLLKVGLTSDIRLSRFNNSTNDYKFNFNLYINGFRRLRRKSNIYSAFISTIPMIIGGSIYSSGILEYIKDSSALLLIMSLMTSLLTFILCRKCLIGKLAEKVKNKLEEYISYSEDEDDRIESKSQVEKEVDDYIRKSTW